jgi:signal peptidase I
VIASGESTVEMRNGVVYVDGAELHEPYVAAPADGATGAVVAPRKLERDTYFVLVDNRAHSVDSRAFGPVTRDRLIGRVLALNFGTGQQ